MYFKFNMASYKRILFPAWAIFLSVFTSSISSAGGSETAAEQLARTLADITEMQAGFEQTMTDESGELLDEASGWFAWQRPDRFRWETLQPVEQSILIDGEQYYQYDRDLDQLLVQPLSEEIGVLPRLLMSGSAQKIEEKFSVQALSSGGSAATYQLAPRETSELFSSISLVFDDDKLLSMSIADELGQSNHFSFSPLEAIDKNSLPLFELKPEPGTEVIYQ